MLLLNLLLMLLMLLLLMPLPLPLLLLLLTWSARVGMAPVKQGRWKRNWYPSRRGMRVDQEKKREPVTGLHIMVGEFPKDPNVSNSCKKVSSR